MPSQFIPLLGVASPGYTAPPLRTITINATRDGQQTSGYKEAVLWASLYERAPLVIFPLKNGLTAIRSFVAAAVDGKKALLLYDFDTQPYSTVRTPNITADIVLNIDLNDGSGGGGGLPSFTGNGWFSATDPELLTKVDGLPASVKLRVLYRPEDGGFGYGTLVTEVQSNNEGEWLVSGLNEELHYDIVASFPDCNDVIVSSVKPVRGP